MHDQNFKNLILDYPHEALSFFAATEAEFVDRAKVTPIRQEQLQERLGKRFRELDTPLLVEWPDGSRGALLFLVEEETTTRRFSIHRLAHYCLDVAELLAMERIVPVVIFLNTGQRLKHLALGGDGDVYLDFHYLACELKGLSAEDYLDSGNIVARVNLPNMRYSKADRLRVYAAAMAGLAQLEPDTERKLKYTDFIDYYADLTEEEIGLYRDHYLPQKGDVMGLAAILRQEGKQEGRQEGKQEGEAAFLLMLLELKFGSLDEQIRQRVSQADADTLLVWGARILMASTLEDVFLP